MGATKVERVITMSHKELSRKEDDIAIGPKSNWNLRVARTKLVEEPITRTPPI